MVTRVAVDQAADRLAYHIINTGLAAGADGHEILLGHCRGRGDSGATQGRRKHKGEGLTFHGKTPVYGLSENESGTVCRFLKGTNADCRRLQYWKHELKCSGGISFLLKI